MKNPLIFELSNSSNKSFEISILGRFEKPMETAEECRQRGNELLQRGDFADAAQQYDQGLLALLPCQAGGTPRPLVAVDVGCVEEK